MVGTYRVVRVCKCSPTIENLCVARCRHDYGLRTSLAEEIKGQMSIVTVFTIPLQQRAGMVYRISCGTCSGVYVGQTCRTLDHRLKEHKRALTSGNLAQSAVAEHAANESHVIDWKGAKVVDTHPRYHQRCALESWHIRSETTTMNRDDGSLPQAYNTLLNYPRKPHTPH